MSASVAAEVAQAPGANIGGSGGSSSSSSSSSSSKEIWEVVGGREKGGVIVRSGLELSSPQATARLAPGALVEGLELHGERLRYRRLSGIGPNSGWVSVRVGAASTPLLLRRPAAVLPEAPSKGEGKVESRPMEPVAASPKDADVETEVGRGGKDAMRSSLECTIRSFLPEDGTSLFCLERICFDKDDSLLREWVAQAEGARSETFVDVAISTGRSLLGYVAWALDPYLAARPCFKVLSLAVAGHRRGKGVGEQLLRNVAAHGHERWADVDTIRLTVREDNAPARRLYARMGFRQVGVIRRKYADCDGLDMELRLSASA